LPNKVTNSAASTAWSIVGNPRYDGILLANVAFTAMRGPTSSLDGGGCADPCARDRRLSFEADRMA
jgi:hypothetical protein